MHEPIRVLVADDDRAIRLVVKQSLEACGCTVTLAENSTQLWEHVLAAGFDVLVSDVLMPDGNGLDLLPKIRDLHPQMPVIVMSAQNTLMTAVTATQRGAFDYLAKPFDLDELERTVLSAAREARQNAVQTPKDEAQADIPLIGRSAVMQDLYRAMARLMPTDLTVTITGESGTGKELVARALHDMGHRHKGPFVAVNMAAIPKDLIESDLFGHERGAFTGANSRAVGRFEQANSGTLFLDEIGDMPIEAQTRLLRVLQEGEFTMVGGSTPIRADVRIIAATNKDLKALVAAHRFREDLYYRLNVVPLTIPPLRARLSDIPDLLAHFNNRAVAQGLPGKRFDGKALSRLCAYSWPGNVRELENLVQRLCVLAPEETIGEATIAQILDAEPESENGAGTWRESGLKDAVEHHLTRYFKAHGTHLPPSGLHARVVREVERPLIELALKATKGNQLKSAELLGLNRNTLRKKIRELGIHVARNGF
ncbi:nitrogen assimilation regulatory protein [Iodidimonas muriae]|uniref:DNA-binding transcriptional regulator NtrC n=1 Tax=Iodidimonas muriae TaxID=261467 RepID=A0ABQ2L7S9_9PROT|nr:nitrogen regulation protein NR(I) [Iodidimonas muriae]GER08117.1 nitrogen assimilation regulatory protein [Kordiimonadales bacterium JCM 17843]GGO06120.1 nitrogen assimilation regulatory protein [Iodidimonas muriae]